MDSLVFILMSILACIGFLQVATWVAVHISSKGNKIYRIIPIGGEGSNTGKQMAFMYTCLQWESNPAKQKYVLYNAGLSIQGVYDCETLAKDAGVYFAHNDSELESLLHR